jgi:hypothetical protein
MHAGAWLASETSITLGEPHPDLPAFDARDGERAAVEWFDENYLSQRAVIDCRDRACDLICKIPVW